MRYLLILLFISSCATAKKKAIELSENGRHEEALEFWNLAIKKDPNDEEIRNGFQASVEHVSNDRLTRIRDKRLQNNQEEALREMKSLVELQKKWNIKLDFNSSSFQGKEVNYLWPFYKSIIETKLKDKRPLGAESLQKEYRDVFNSIRDYETVQGSISKKGIEQCQDLKNIKGDSPFFGSFVSQFCQYFKGKGLHKTAVSEVSFRKTIVEAEIANITDTSKGNLETVADKILPETPWHHPEAKREIRLRVKGEYNWKPRSEIIQEAHNYLEKVPYTDYETVKKTRTVPYDDLSNGVRVTKYRTESYQEKEPVTRYRDVPRIYHYMATKKSMEVNLNLKGEIQILSESYPIFFQKSLKEEKILHDMNLPKIGLYPKREDVKPPLTHFEDLSRNVGEQLRSDLNAIWEKKFCSLPVKRDFAAVAENVTRCRKLARYPEAFVDTWFENNFGVKSSRATEIIGSF
jgi:hypothetical protein